jgi:hypothetical protein
MSGNEVPGKSRDEQYASLLEATRRAGDLAAKANLTSGVLQFFEAIDASTTDGKVTSEAFIAQGDTVVSTGRYSATV